LTLTETEVTETYSSRSLKMGCNTWSNIWRTF